MELSEVINPHYAFPVVGVLLCALLVFAFGFKSPAQPPSFDFEDERKTSGSKKRKHVKKSVSSGTSVALDSSPRVNSEKVSKQSAEKQTVPIKVKPTLVEQNSVNKPQLKNKKSEKNERNAQKKKEENVNQDKHNPKKEEAGEWVQLLTRKEKKNRKRDELYGVGDDDEGKNDGSKGGTPEKKQPAIIDSQENSPSKKKKKKANKESVEKKDVKSEQNVKVENAKNEMLINEKIDQDNNYNTVSEKKNVINLKETSQAQMKGEELNTVLQMNAIVPEQVKTQESTEETSQESKAEANVGVVAFDELKDVWQEPKTQKKKKKVRRDQ